MMCGPADRLRTTGVWLAILAAVLLEAGCGRSLYRRQADRESHYLVREKSIGTPWEIPENYTVQPDPRSRFFDPTPTDHPILPPAGPQLYAYSLPIPGRPRSTDAEVVPAPQPNGTQSNSPSDSPSNSPSDGEPLPLPKDLTNAPGPVPRNLADEGGSDVALVAHQEELEMAPPPEAPAEPESSVDSPPNPVAEIGDPFDDDISVVTESRSDVKGFIEQRIDQRYWNDMPKQCLARMVDFASVRDEYARTFGTAPSPAMMSQAPRMSFEDLFELALLNSREYQRQKELLYEAALTLSLERFAYATKFTVRGTTVDTTYTHRRVDGITVNSLAAPTSLTGDKLLATSGTLVGQFANSVVMTFNGPSGFAADVSSEILLDFTQRVFQRDILLEPLIQSERDLVYAARRYARFRKEFFFDVASTYYNILLTYRRVEIDAQNYFSQALNFQQARAEISSEITNAPNVVFYNQYEQGVLTARSTLIRQCLQLEDELDQMKLTLGLPTETLIDVDLTELEQLTLRDMIEVNREQVRRWQARLETLRAKALTANHADILTADYSLAERLISWFLQRRRIDPNVAEPVELYQIRARFRLDAARLEAGLQREALAESQTATPPKQRILIFQRQIDMIDAQLLLLQRQGQFATRSNVVHEVLDKARSKYRQTRLEFDGLQEDLNKALEHNPDDTVIIGLIDRATRTLAELDTITQDLDDVLFGGPVNMVEPAETLARTRELEAYTQAAFQAAEHGLPPIDISADEAMITSLVQRLDLMNERGTLADRWREIKIAADELKSRLDLQASQAIGTEKNRPFSFSTDNSQTRVGLTWDLPLNRKRDRNLYRRTLINYNVGIRDLQQYEDTIKLNVRRQLRNLEQARVQYPISVAQAALAEEQVLSTRLQLILGMPGVRAPDLLLAYNDSREALSAMVVRRIGYIVERARFALELEAMMLDDTGFWPEINDPQYQPRPNFTYPWTAGAAYGDFPSFLKVSREFRKMLNYPPPGAAGAAASDSAPEETDPTEPEAADPEIPDPPESGS